MVNEFESKDDISKSFEGCFLDNLFITNEKKVNNLKGVYTVGRNYWI